MISASSAEAAEDKAESAIHRAGRGLPYWPRSMMGLVATSKALTVLPLMLAIIFIGFQLEQILVKTESLVANSQEIESLSAELRDDLRNLERVARQQLVLRNPELEPVYRERLQSVSETAAQLGGDVMPVAVAKQVRQLSAQLSVLSEVEDTTDMNAGIRRVERIVDLKRLARRIAMEGRMTVFERLRGLSSDIVGTNRFLTLILLVLLPLTLLMAVGLSVLVTRPLNKVRYAIAALGTANYDDEIEIKYPSEMARLGQRLDWLRGRLQSYEAEKDRFFRDVSHELKTPLASLREGSELLLEPSFDSLTNRQREVAQILAESAQDLDAQIGNLLAYSEWQSSQRHFATAWINSRSLVTDVLSSQRLLFARRKLRAKVRFETPRLFGHMSSLRIAFSNVMNNAIKHSPKGTTILIAVTRAKDRFNLVVRDHGAGIPAEERNKILEPFVRGSTPQFSGLHGTGIGLSIVNETIKAHDGTLEIKDANPGTLFILSWPCPPADAG